MGIMDNTSLLVEEKGDFYVKLEQTVKDLGIGE